MGCATGRGHGGSSAQYQVLWKALEDAGITRGDGCPDSILIEEVTKLRAEVERLRAETADLWNKWSDAEEKRERAEAREHSERAQHFMRRMDKAEAALRIIAGEAQCVDNLMSNVEVARAALRDTAPAEEPEPEMWRCIECGETFDGPRVSHGRDAHAPGCTGSCDGSCPIQVECGPVERLPAPAEGPHCPHGNPPGSARDCACRTEERHWQDDADPNPGRAQAAYQAEQARVAEGTVGGVSTISPWRKPYRTWVEDSRGWPVDTTVSVVFVARPEGWEP